MSTESRLQCRCPTGKPQCSSGFEGGREGEGARHHWKSPRHVALCASVSRTDFLMFFPFAYMASNSISIVYMGQAALHSKVTVISSPLPSSSLVSSVSLFHPERYCLLCLSCLSVFSLSALTPDSSSFSSSSLFCLKGWMVARSEPQQGSAAQKAVRHSVPRSCWAAILYFMSRRSAPSINITPCYIYLIATIIDLEQAPIQNVNNSIFLIVYGSKFWKISSYMIAFLWMWHRIRTIMATKAQTQWDELILWVQWLRACSDILRMQAWPCS